MVSDYRTRDEAALRGFESLAAYYEAQIEEEEACEA